MHRPTAPRSCAVRRVWVREGLVKGSSGRFAAGDRLEILCLDVAHEGSRRKRLARGVLQQFLHRDLCAEPMHMSAQPAEKTRELAVGQLLIERGKLSAQTLVELSGDGRPERIGGEIAEGPHRPVYVLKAAIDVVRGANPEP